MKKLIALIAAVILIVFAVAIFAGCDQIKTRRTQTVDQAVSSQKARFEEAVQAFIVQRDKITRDYAAYIREKVLLDSMINQGHRVGDDLEELMKRRLELKEKYMLLKSLDAEYTYHIEALDQEMKYWDEKHPGWWK